MDHIAKAGEDIGLKYIDYLYFMREMDLVCGFFATIMIVTVALACVWAIYACCKED